MYRLSSISSSGTGDDGASGVDSDGERAGCDMGT